MIITILVDNLRSWIVPHAERLVRELRALVHEVHYVHEHSEVVKGELAFFLGCERLVKPETLAKNKHNLVVHESALPAGKGWSPLTWQILEGKNDIPITLFEAQESVDSGDIYLQDEMHFEGHELNSELKHAQGRKTMELVKKFVAAYPNIPGRKQHGEESFYLRRIAKDSEIDPNKTIAEQFNLLRVVDNERYPAFFRYKEKKYILKIEKAQEN